MVADMELSAEDIATLRLAISYAPSKSKAGSDALAILNRLPPPEQEQPDEATVWATKTLASINISRSRLIAAARQVLSELVASKDAEIAKAQLWAMEQHKCADEYASELAALRAENERLKGDVLPPDGYKNLHIAARDCIFDANGLGRIEDGWLLLESVNVSVTSKAAERNTAEPATDTAPVVEVTVDGGMDAEAVEQAELLWAQLPVNRKWISIPTHEKALVCHLLSTYHTEAEARGRRAALEKTDDEWREIIRKVFAAAKICPAHYSYNPLAAIRELKRLMTDGK